MTVKLIMRLAAKMTFTLIFMISGTIISGQGTGLVLSGGGAKGLAHIGVIKALEENNIKIDYISGTSMGAIVGGLYVMGYSPDEMRDLVVSEEFTRWSTGAIDQNLRFTYKRAESDPSMFTINLKTEDDKTQPEFPAYLIPSEVMDFGIMIITAGANSASKNNFDSLMVPFRCVASDVYNKRAVIFKEGNLGQAVRASMSYPLYFEPVVIDSVLLFDGGIYNNFPFDVLQSDFNPDFIIGSKVVSRSKRPGRDDLMLQLQNMIMQETNYIIPDSAGIVIETKFSDVSLFDLEGADSIINSGYINALKMIPQIIPFVKSIDSLSLAGKREKFKRQMPDTIFSQIVINGVGERQKEYISNLITKRGKVFSAEQLKREYFNLVTEENIARIYPEAVYDPESAAYILNLGIDLKGAYSLSTGGLISLSTYNQVFMGFNYYSMTDIFNMFSANIYLGQFYSSFKLAHRIAVPQKKSLLVDFSLIANKWNYYTNEAPSMFESASTTYVVRNSRSFKASVGTPAGINSLFRGGISFSWIDDKYYPEFIFSAQEEPDRSEYFYTSIRTSFENNSLNRRQFASGGNEFSAAFSYNYGFEFYNEGIEDPASEPEKWTTRGGWFAFKFRNENYAQISDKFVLGSLIDVTISNRQLGHNYTSTTINAYKFDPTPTSKQLFGRTLRANSYIGGGIMPLKVYGNGFQIRSGAFLFIPVRRIEDALSGVEYSPYFDQLSTAAELAIIYHSRAGPISVGVNYFSQEKSKFLYFFNFGYILFNGKGL